MNSNHRDLTSLLVTSSKKWAFFVACLYLLSLPHGLKAQSNAYNGCDGRGSYGGNSSNSQSAASQLAQQQAEARRQQILNAEQALAQQRLAQQQQAANQHLQLAQGIMGILTQHPSRAASRDDEDDDAGQEQARQQAETRRAQLEAANRVAQAARVAAEAQQEAARSAAEAKEQEQRNQTILANEKQEFSGLLGDYRSGAFAAGNSSLSSTMGSSVGPLAREVSSQTVKVLANEMFDQVLNGEMSDVSKAARSGTVSVIKDAVYDVALDLLPPGKATEVRAYRIPLSYLTMNFSKINAAYSDLYQKDFADKANKVTTNVRPTSATLPPITLSDSQSSAQNHFDLWKLHIINQIASCDSMITMWTNSLNENRKDINSFVRGSYGYNICVQNIEHATAEIEKSESQKADLQAQLQNPPSFL